MESVEDSRSNYPFEFNGNAREYFGIWIVNLLLSIVTLGIYSAWAKVRTNRYFYGNTSVAGSGFEYTAEPVNILKGRILAVILLIVYQVLVNFYPSLAVFALPLVFTIIPVIYVISLAFRMRYSSWRGINFSFQKDFKGAYLLFSPLFVYFLLIAIIPYFLGLSQEDLTSTEENPEIAEQLLWYAGSTTLVFLLFAALFPLWQKKYYEFVGNRTHFGCSDFSIELNNSAFYGMYLKSSGLLMLGFIPAGIAIYIAASSLDPENLDSAYLVLALYPAVLVPYLVAYAYLQTRLTNELYSLMTLDGITFKSELVFTRMLSLYFTNTLAIIFSLGLAIPWAKVRLADYRAQSMTMMATELDFVIGKAGEEVDANADAFSDVFDFDIGL